MHRLSNAKHKFKFLPISWWSPWSVSVLILSCLLTHQQNSARAHTNQAPSLLSTPPAAHRAAWLQQQQQLLQQLYLSPSSNQQAHHTITSPRITASLPWPMRSRLP